MIKKLFNGATLTQLETTDLFNQMLDNKFDPILISALLMAFKFHHETSSEISGAADSLLSFSKPFKIEKKLFADCCGTGGDGKGLLNISTAVAFVASACGLPIVKHGNRSVSSLSGSADVLEHIGVKLITDTHVLKEQFNQFGLTFVFAPFFHPALKHIMPIRTTLATRTLFNLLGPLVNPARPPVQLMGVYHQNLCQPVAEALVRLGVGNGMVVHGSGLDEIAVHDVTKLVLIKNGNLSTETVNVSDFGVQSHSLDQLVGAKPEHNAKQLMALLKGEGKQAYVDAVAVNTSALLFCAGLSKDFKQGVEKAKQVIAEGGAFKVLEGIISLQIYPTHSGS